jgi:hypothetical protein
MNGENIIPKITDKRGMLWKQPHRRYIEIDEEYALMTKQTFEGLREYSVTIPSGGNMKGRCGRPIEEVYGIYIGMIMTIIHQ